MAQNPFNIPVAPITATFKSGAYSPTHVGKPVLNFPVSAAYRPSTSFPMGGSSSSFSSVSSSPSSTASVSQGMSTLATPTFVSETGAWTHVSPGMATTDYTPPVSTPETESALTDSDPGNDDIARNLGGYYETSFPYGSYYGSTFVGGDDDYSSVAWFPMETYSEFDPEYAPYDEFYDLERYQIPESSWI